MNKILVFLSTLVFTSFNLNLSADSLELVQDLNFEVLQSGSLVEGFRSVINGDYIYYDIDTSERKVGGIAKTDISDGSTDLVTAIRSRPYAFAAVRDKTVLFAN